MAWVRKHHNQFVYRLTRLYLRQLQREENNHLKDLREQILGDFPQAVSILYNPLLYARSPKEAILLMDQYAVWPGQGNDFDQLNDVLEPIYQKHFSAHPFGPLKSQEKLTSAQSEIYDELGGLFAAQSILGPSEDQKELIEEDFSWLDHPGNIQLLFDEKLHEKLIGNAKDSLGFSGSWGLKGDLKKLSKIA